MKDKQAKSSRPLAAGQEGVHARSGTVTPNEGRALLGLGVHARSGTVSAKRRRVLLQLAGLLALAALSVAWHVQRSYRAALDEPLRFAPSEQHYLIPRGASLKSVLAELEQKGLIAHPAYLRYAAHRAGLARRIQAGEYVLRSGMTPMELLEQFASGRVVQHSLTLVEGWRFSDVMRAVRNHPALRQTLADDQPGPVLAALGATQYGEEGLFLADTWHFPRDSSDVALLRRAHRALWSSLEEQWRRRPAGLPYDSPWQALVMASLVEKEVGLPSEREQVAGVFVRRLQRGMRLQSDPTVIFAMGDAYQGNIRKRDLALDSPHNTYRYKGLPPTPIAIVGKAALQAALQPAEGDSLYFVSRGNGSHQFSATLAEHNRAVRKYQLKK